MDRPESTSFELRSHTVSHNPHRAGASTSEHTATPRGKQTPQPGWDGVVNCEFLEIEAQKRISWAWVVGDIDTVVTFTLTPTASGTLLSLVQSGFKPAQKQNFGGARYGWTMMGKKLVDVLARSE